jgi:TRAP-type C4-dicarboxylate transport system permease small subunit
MVRLGHLYDVGVALAALCVAFTALLVIAQIVGRLAGVLVPSVPEVAGFMLGATIFLALPATMRRGEHIRIDLFLPHLPAFLRLALEIGYRLVGALLMIFLTYQLSLLAYDSWYFGDRSAGLVGIPVWIAQAAMTVGSLLMVVRFSEEAVSLIRCGHAVPPGDSGG